MVWANLYSTCTKLTLKEGSRAEAGLKSDADAKPGQLQHQHTRRQGSKAGSGGSILHAQGRGCGKVLAASQDLCRACPAHVPSHSLAQRGETRARLSLRRNCGTQEAALSVK